MKLLAWLLLGILVIWALRSKKAGVTEKTTQPRHLDAPELMVKCAHCGVYLPASEAITQSGELFCSEEHRHLHLSS